MAKKKGKKQEKKVYICDFETANNAEINDKETYVWLGVSIDMRTDHVENIAHNVEEYYEWFTSLNGGTFYFHNLAFDGNFLLAYLMKIGYKPITGQERDRRFEIICDDFNRIFRLRVIDHKRSWTFYDSLKIIPLSEHDLAKKFGLSVQKGSIDYTKARPKGYRATKKEIEYCINDVKIISEALRYFESQGWLHGFTIGMISFKEFKHTCPNWRYFFPKLSQEDDEFIRRSYRGGISYANPAFQGQVVGEGEVYDANSLYPSQMLLKPMPVGYPRYFTGKPDFGSGKLFVVHFTCTFKVKPHHMPMLQLKNNLMFNPREFLTQSDEIVDLYLTTPDYQTFFEQYDVFDVTYIDGYYFEKATGIFDEFIHRFQKIKENNKGALRQIAKLILNNLYGKFGTNPVRWNKTPYLNNGKVSFLIEGMEEIDPVYIPVAAFITAYGRRELVHNAQANWNRFLYCDTDSVHLLGRALPKDIKIDDKKFGYWKCESRFLRGKYLRAKTYAEDTIDYETPSAIALHTDIKCAGLPYEVKKTIKFDDFHVGAVFEGKLARKAVIGGVILKSTTFEIKG